MDIIKSFIDRLEVHINTIAKKPSIYQTYTHTHTTIIKLVSINLKKKTQPNNGLNTQKNYCYGCVSRISLSIIVLCKFLQLKCIIHPKHISMAMRENLT